MAPGSSNPDHLRLASPKPSPGHPEVIEVIDPIFELHRTTRTTATEADNDLYWYTIL